MKQTIYTVIAYVSGTGSWHDRWGDYHKGQESEVKIEYFTDIQSAGESMGKAKFLNDDTEFTVLINGLNEDQQHDFLSDDEQQEIENVSQQIRDVHYAVIKDMKQIKLQQEEEAKLKKAQETEFIGRRERQRQEQAECAQLAQLQTKYGKEAN